MQKINRNPEWNDRPAGTFDLHSWIAGFVWCKFWISIAHYLEHFNEQPCSRNFENLLLIFGGIAQGWYFLFITRDDVVSQRLKFGSAFLSYSWESKNALFFQLSCIPSPSRTNCVIFIGCNFESRAIQVGLHKENKDTASAKKGELCLLVSWFTVKKPECLEFNTYEVVARSVASRPKNNTPLAKKLLRSTCM